MAAEVAPSGATMVDAQMGTVKVLKPFAGFEGVYQGQQALTPIAFPGTLDKRAEDGSPGFDPKLLKGIPVPQGSRVLLWLPMCFYPVDPETPDLAPFQLYSYRLIWRFQNLAGYRNPAATQKRPPWHFPRQSPGAPDTTIVPFPGSPRVPIPASWHVIAYEDTEPATAGVPGQLGIRVEMITPKLNSLTNFVAPLLRDGTAGVVEQGVADPAFVPGALMPIYVPFWTDAEGDELIIFATRTGATADVADVWDFTASDKDLAFSNIYGTGNGTHPSYRDIGIYMQTGTTP